MAERETERRKDEASERIVGSFEDASTAELAAITVVRHGFAVQLLDSTTVAVQPGSRRQDTDEIKGMLAAYGAANVGDASASGTRPDETRLVAVRPDASTRLDLAEEELRPYTRPVVAGEVLIRKDVVRENVTIEVPVVREELVVERRPIDQSATDRTAQRSTDPLLESLSERLREMAPGESLRIPLIEEEVTVSTQPVVRSEVMMSESPGTRRTSDERADHLQWLAPGASK
jgi:uncharacterized protein (TIGR02271 family)